MYNKITEGISALAITQRIHGVSQRNMEDKLTGKIIGAAIEVHKALAPGLLESAYQECLFFELKSMGLNVLKEISLPIIYKDIN